MPTDSVMQLCELLGGPTGWASLAHLGHPGEPTIATGSGLGLRCPRAGSGVRRAKGQELSPSLLPESFQNFWEPLWAVRPSWPPWDLDGVPAGPRLQAGLCPGEGWPLSWGGLAPRQCWLQAGTPCSAEATEAQQKGQGHSVQQQLQQFQDGED